MLRVAVPNKGSLSERAAVLLKEAGYRGRTESKELTIIDVENDVEFFFLRPKDIATYVGRGELDFGITGRDLAADSGADVEEQLALGFGGSTFRYAAPAHQEWSVEKLAGKRIATSYCTIVENDLAARGIDATVIGLDGAVETSIQLGVADAIADVVSTGRTLRNHGLAAFGDTLVVSEGVLITRPGVQLEGNNRRFFRRIQGVVFAQQFMMLDYDCPKALVESAIAITPGIEAPTLSPMSDQDWVAIRALVPRKHTNRIMDELSALGAKAILASDIRSCRM